MNESKCGRRFLCNGGMQRKWSCAGKNKGTTSLPWAVSYVWEGVVPWLQAATLAYTVHARSPACFDLLEFLPSHRREPLLAAKGSALQEEEGGGVRPLPLGKLFLH
ncbi:unnamed protein product [Mortierella alpina]